MKKQRRSFSTEFKQDAASLILDQGYSFTEASRAVDVHENTLRNWAQQLRSERGGETPTSKALTAEQQRIQELEARVERLEREKTILKNVWSAAICQRILLLIDYVGQHKCIRTVCELFLLGSVHDEDPRTSSLKRPMSF